MDWEWAHSSCWYSSWECCQFSYSTDECPRRSYIEPSSGDYSANSTAESLQWRGEGQKEEEASEEKPVKGKSPKSKKKDFETIEEFLEDGEYESIDGFLNIYKETEKNKYYMVLTKDDLEKEFLYFAYVLNAPPGSGVMSGEMIGDSQIGNGVILEFRKFNNKIGLYKKNTYFSNDTDNNIAKRDTSVKKENPKNDSNLEP